MIQRRYRPSCLHAPRSGYYALCYVEPYGKREDRSQGPPMICIWLMYELFFICVQPLLFRTPDYFTSKSQVVLSSLRNYYVVAPDAKTFLLAFCCMFPFIVRRGFNYELGRSSLAFFARGTNSQLTSASLKGAKDLSGELFYLPWRLHSRGEVFSNEPTSLLARLLAQGKLILN